MSALCRIVMDIAWRVKRAVRNIHAARGQRNADQRADTGAQTLRPLDRERDGSKS